MLVFDMSLTARSPCPLLSVVSKHSTHLAWVVFCVSAPCFCAVRWWGRVWGVRFLVRVFMFGRVARLSQSGHSGLCVLVVAVAGISIGLASAVCRTNRTLLSSLCRQVVCSFSTVCMSASLLLMALSMAICWGEESCMIGSITVSCVGARGNAGRGVGCRGASVVVGVQWGQTRSFGRAL